MEDDTGYEEHRQVKRRGERIKRSETSNKGLVLLGLIALVVVLFVLVFVV